VQVELASGSVMVTYRIEVPPGTTREALEAQLKASRTAIAERAKQLSRAIPGFNEVLTGPLCVQVCGEAQEQGGAWKDRATSCVDCGTPVAAAPVPLGSMPADLNSALAFDSSSAAPSVASVSWMWLFAGMVAVGVTSISLLVVAKKRANLATGESGDEALLDDLAEE